MWGFLSALFVLQLPLLELQLVLFVKGVLVGVVYDVTMLKDNWGFRKWGTRVRVRRSLPSVE